MARSHSCSSVGLPKTTNNRCAAQMEAKGKSMKMSSEEYQEDEREPSCGLNDERYLASMASDLARPNRSPVPELNNAHETNQELLHVLVTKPEIAGKPRDNIVFEGDMDLKTTFETSYEALAKMRLDYWKKYQLEQQQQEENNKQQLKRHQRDHTQRKGSFNKQGNARSHKNQDPQESTKADPEGSVSVISRGKNYKKLSKDDQSEAVEALSGLVSPKTKVVDSSQAASVTPTRAAQLAPPSRSPKTGSGSVVAAGLISDYSGQRDGSSQRKLVKRQTEPTALSLVSTTTPAPAPAATTTTTTTTTRASATPNAKQDTYIDPDLSPIIVYDANMNRLEKVGIRKRSKYRPSTSLRSGARGLFGDQNDDTLAVKPRNLEYKQQVEPDTGEFQLLPFNYQNASSPLTDFLISPLLSDSTRLDRSSSHLRWPPQLEARKEGRLESVARTSQCLFNIHRQQLAHRLETKASQQHQHD